MSKYGMFKSEKERIKARDLIWDYARINRIIHLIRSEDFSPYLREALGEKGFKNLINKLNSMSDESFDKLFGTEDL
jgi:hypothetical protein